MRPALVLALVLLATPALAAERVDLFDKNGNRTGYVTIDPQTGRLDTYNAQSRHTGWGRVDPGMGRGEVYDMKGQWRETVVPVWPSPAPKGPQR